MSEDLILDCRGLACPGPVMRCLEVIEKQAPGGFVVLLDDPAARENVTRLLDGKGYAVAVAEDLSTGPAHCRLSATRQDTTEAPGVAGANTDADEAAMLPRSKETPFTK